jgi:hypothetical protein
MDLSAYIGSAAAGLAYLVLAVRLLWLGIRTGMAAARLLGLAFLLWTLTYVFWVAAVALQNQPALDAQFSISSHIANNLGEIAFAYFPLLVFRQGSTWAKCLSASIAICLVVGTTGSILAGDAAGAEPLTNAWWWFEWLGETTNTIWVGAEGLNHYGISRRRVRLGLCEPIEGHRYLLWGIAGILWTLLSFVVVGQYVEAWAAGSRSALLDNTVGLIEFVALAMVWFIFFPPRFYQHWLAGSAPAAHSGEA